jgi:diguanylate cyclase (GGDEF)-like protein/PAS domain S-box-containing protein
MVKYPGKVFGAVYLPSAALLWAVCLLSIIVATGYRYTSALDERLGLLDLYAENRVDAVSGPSFEPESDVLAWRNNTSTSAVFHRINASGSFYLAAGDQYSFRVYRMDKRETLESVAEGDPALATAPYAPLALALAGQSGRWQGRDTEGRVILGSYSPSRDGRFGLLIAIKSAEISAPYIRDAIVAVIISTVGVAAILLAAIAMGARYRRKAEDVESVYQERVLLAAKVFDSVIEGITITDTEGKILSVNRAFTEITGWSEEEALGQNPRILKSERHDPSFYRAMWKAIEEHGQWEGEIWNRRKDGKVYPEWLSITAVKGQDGKARRYVAVFRDLTDIKNREEAISWLSNNDPLTDLPNRVLFSDRLMTAIKGADRSREKIAVLYLDIDRFKYINTTYGYRLGDSILQLVAGRLTQSLRKSDTVARVSADDFLVLLPQLAKEEFAVAAAESILSSLRRPMLVEGQEVYLDASIGVSYYPNDGLDADALIGAANSAMTIAKESGAGSFHIFTQSLNTRISKRMSLEGRLRKAVESRAFAVYYQPRVELPSRRVVGMEALVRWIDGETVVPPSDFIPLAEENGLIIPIGEWVLETALADLKRWLSLDPKLWMSVNLSGRQFKLPDLESRIVSYIELSGVPPDRVELEITESVAMEDVGRSTAVMTALSKLGVGFSLDDFGTGYSSLYYLKRLPLDWLKIDQSFVRDIRSASEGQSNAIAATVIEMARSLGMGTIAEGCETEEQLRFLIDRGCQYVQGYYFSKPVPAAEFERFIGATLA